ncbi:MAG: PAS domain S-box protein [Flavobacteriales bacterium]
MEIPDTNTPAAPLLGEHNKREDRLLLAARAAGLGVFEWRIPEDVWVWENERMYGIFGRRPEEGPLTTAQLLAEVLDPADAEALRADLLGSLSTKGTVGHACRIRRLDNGEQRTVEFSYLLQEDDNGCPLRVVGVMADTTERQRTLKAAQHQAAIVESSSDAIVSKDLNGTILSWNRGAQNMFGYTAEEIVGRPVTMLFPPGLENEELAIVERIRNGERVEHYETIRMRKDGSLLNVSLSISPIKDERGHVVGASKIARDITEQKRLEEALQRSNRHKDHFLATLAHELRNPLAPLCNGLEVLLAEPGEEELRNRTHAMMQRQMDHLVRLVDDLMDVSRISRGKVHLVREPVDVGTIVHTAVEACDALITGHGHDLHVRVEPGLRVRGDTARLTQVVVNLLTNAAKYTPAKGRIDLTVERADTNAVIRVADNGIGIPADAMDRVFDMFAQVAPEEQTRTGGGLGIGLHIVRQLVGMHGGTVNGSSPGLGQGSTFTIELPLIPTANTTGRPAVATAELPGTGLRILVVDDNTDATFTMGILLRKRGHTVEVANSGLAALEIGEGFKPEVVLMDIGMPGLSGYDTCARMRGTCWGRDARIMAISGWGQAEDRRRSAAAGFDEHLVKPVDSTQLQRLLVERRNIH